MAAYFPKIPPKPPPTTSVRSSQCAPSTTRFSPSHRQVPKASVKFILRTPHFSQYTHRHDSTNEPPMNPPLTITTTNTMTMKQKTKTKTTKKYQAYRDRIKCEEREYRDCIKHEDHEYK